MAEWGGGGFQYNYGDIQYHKTQVPGKISSPGGSDLRMNPSSGIPKKAPPLGNFLLGWGGGGVVMIFVAETYFELEGYITLVSWASAHCRVSTHVPLFKGSM